MQIAREPVRAVGRLEIDGHALARRVLHAPVIVDVGEQEVAALLPPEWPLGGSQRAAEAGCQFLDRLVHGNDLVELRRKPIDAWLHLRLRLRPRTACAACRQAGDRAGHLQCATASNFALVVHNVSSLAIACCCAYEGPHVYGTQTILAACDCAGKRSGDDRRLAPLASVVNIRTMARSQAQPMDGCAPPGSPPACAAQKLPLTRLP